MRNYVTIVARAALLALALMLAGAAQARTSAAPPQPVATTNTAARIDEYPAERDETPVGGILIIAGVVGGVILLAWVCSRIGDSRITM